MTSIVAYPNPATDRIYISGLNNYKTTLSLYDQLGRIVKRASEASISVKGCSSGLYFLVVVQDGFQTVVPIVVAER